MDVDDVDCAAFRGVGELENNAFFDSADTHQIRAPSNKSRPNIRTCDCQIAVQPANNESFETAKQLQSSAVTVRKNCNLRLAATPRVLQRSLLSAAWHRQWCPHHPTYLSSPLLLLLTIAIPLITTQKVVSR